ncbi:hypothetical protein ACFSSA_12850 [Luteolibacter algae]|uniref:Lipoprotein n=1 Tax=Luteolibacter algae TaxID=454151 RepID=A0ABW5DCC8_9BACT
MKSLLSLSTVLAGAAALLMSSCAPSTPESRIYQNPHLYGRLSKKDQDLVSRGEIANGMSKDAVILAWGNPADKVDGFRDGRRMERWDYTGTKPVVTNNVFGGYRSGYYGPYRYSGFGGGFGPEITYVPYRKSSVWFVNDKVNEWERQR